MNKNILEIICETMILAQRSKIVTTDKKQFVMSVLKLHITDFERYEPFINLLIDFIKLISKNNDYKRFEKTKVFELYFINLLYSIYI